VELTHEPVDNGRADPGEVVWAGGTARARSAWGRVPYEEDPTRGTLDASAVRREGAALDPTTFAAVIEEARAHW
jgi:hypothetical protein